METPDRLLYPSTSSEAIENLAFYEFIGRIVGKCLYENVLVDVEFAPFFLLRWFGRHAYLDDLPSLACMGAGRRRHTLPGRQGRARQSRYASGPYLLQRADAGQVRTDPRL